MNLAQTLIANGANGMLEKSNNAVRIGQLLLAQITTPSSLAFAISRT